MRWTIYFEHLARPTESAPIARLRLNQRSLSFAWVTPLLADELRAELANCFLELKAGAARHVVQLRIPQTHAPIVLDLDRERQMQEFEIADPSAIDRVSLRIGQLVGFPAGAKLRKADAIIQQSKSATIVFDDLPGVEIELRFIRTASSKVALRIESVFREANENELPLMRQRLEALEQGYRERLAQALRELGVSAADESNRAADLDSLGQARGMTPDESNRIKQAKGSAIAAGILSSVKASQNRQRSSRIRARLKTIGDLRNLVEALHGKATITFTIGQDGGDQRLILIDGESFESRSDGSEVTDHVGGLLTN